MSTKSKISINRKTTKFLVLLMIITAIAPTIASADDEIDDEFGTWWVKDYDDNPYCSSVLYTDVEAENFRDKMVYESFNKLFDCSDDGAKESHFECSSVGGDGRYYADNCDFLYFCGHGASKTFWLGTDEDGDDVYKYRVRANAGSGSNEPEWGDADLEWAFIQACQSLKSSDKTEWYDAFDGLHGICGFDTDATASSLGTLGEWTAYYLTEGGEDIHDSWEDATKIAQGSTIDAAILRVEIRIDAQYYDYGDDDIDDPMPDVGDEGALFSTYLYDEWDC